ncbi:S1C family serine protease [Gulosibacter molinativorax]|uniref:PDZ domain-containing protein n=1 Tax=Gulosibacter molinativorax TaxID=256821 RepID=A0ABT7CA88_9MICO|nr:trypsin-like peptidase domain-containing protein [Gulosibacter molinativorax]MDJ1372028.1 PDZ domain-containing protein [Gulosibacter molinativorax]QUY63924.1 Serine protease PepA [Gulosibacter molinativorax]
MNSAPNSEHNHHRGEEQPAAFKSTGENGQPGTYNQSADDSQYGIYGQPGAPGQPGTPGQHGAHSNPRQKNPIKRRILAAGAAFGLVLAGAVGGVAVGGSIVQGQVERQIAEQQTDSQMGSLPSQQGLEQLLPWNLQRDQQQSPNQQQTPEQQQGQSDAASGGTQLDVAPASVSESSGVALIETQLGYQGAAAAGTGIVMSSDGLVLTNNHVISGATQISVTTDNGATYDATVVGTDSTQDVAVLQLDNASGLTPATIDQDNNLAVGDTIAAIGNAGGGGQLMSADGTVVDLNASVSTTSEGAMAKGESLSNMIQIDADVVSGDSGGAVLDNQGEVVGMTTAASSGTSNISGYAIEIDQALSVAQSIIDGVDTGTNTIGTPAFLGIALGTGNGTTIAGVYQNTPAADLGLQAGDTITAIDGITVSSASELSALIAEYTPDTQVSVTWTTAAGAPQTGTATLMAGPAN